MPRAVFEKAARGLLRAFPGVKLVKFFGGEPLLNFALVRFGVSYLRSLGFSSAFEVGTNGLLLDGARLAYFRARPEIQLNVNASFGVKKAFLGLPNLIWNLCVLPDAQGEAVALLRRIAGLSKRARPRAAGRAEKDGERSRCLRPAKRAGAGERRAHRVRAAF